MLRRDTRRSSESRSELATEATSIPHEVGPYLILREVGRGGMGVVYQARHGELGRLVALKMILAGEFASEGQRQRFHREAELAARVQHPQIVQVYEVAVYQGRPTWSSNGATAAHWPTGSLAKAGRRKAAEIGRFPRRGDRRRTPVRCGSPRPQALEHPAEALRRKGGRRAAQGGDPQDRRLRAGVALERKSGLTSTGARSGLRNTWLPSRPRAHPLAGGGHLRTRGDAL